MTVYNTSGQDEGLATQLPETRICLCDYTAEPIYSYMIGKDARHSQVSISKNDHL